MFKVTPNPPDTDPVSPYESPDSNKLNEAAERALNHYFPSTADIKSASRSPSTLFTIDPQAKTESLLVYLVETLASVDVMVHQLVDHLDGDSRYALLGISNSIMVAEITANRMLDQMDPPEYARLAWLNNGVAVASASHCTTDGNRRSRLIDSGNFQVLDAHAPVSHVMKVFTPFSEGLLLTN